MGLLRNLQLLIINLVCWLGWLSCFSFAQSDLSEGLGGFVNISVQGITCIGNIGVFITSLIRGRLDLEMGARDALDILVSAKLKTINGIKDGNGLITCAEGRQTASTQEVRLRKMVGLFRRLRHRLGIEKMVELFRRLLHRLGIEKMVEFFRRLGHRLGIEKMVEFFRRLGHRLGISIGEDDLEEGRSPTASDEIGSLQTASVIMLCNGKPNSSIREFMKTNAPIVGSILLRFIPLQIAINDGEVVTPEVNIENCPCNSCHCIVFWTLEELTIMLALRMPGTLKPLSNSLCLLPCLTCLRNGCHGCNWDSLLRVEGPLPLEQADEGHRVRVSESKVVSEILDDIDARSMKGKAHICICISMHDASSDVWTELLVRSLRSKDAEGRGVRVMASEALEGYLGGRRGGSSECVEYNIVSFIMPRFTEVLINLLLTLWLGVDGFSSALVARRTIRDYVADSKGSGFAANAFLTKAVVKSDFNNTQVCQVLSFRGDLLGIKTLSFIACCVNLICYIVWAYVVSTTAITLSQGGPLVITPAITPDSQRGHAAITADLQRGHVAITAAVGIALFMDSAIILTRLTSIGHRLIYICSIILIPLTMVVKHPTNIYLRLALFGLAIVWRSSSLEDKVFLLTSFLFPCSLILPRILPPLIDDIPALVAILILIVLALLCSVILWTFLNSMERIFFFVIALEIAYFDEVLPSMWIDADSSWTDMGWVYGAVQTLAWVKWAAGSYILSKKNSLEFFGKSPHGWGLLLYSSAFFLNAVMAGVRSNWGEPWILLLKYQISHKYPN